MLQVREVNLPKGERDRGGGSESLPLLGALRQVVFMAEHSGEGEVMEILGLTCGGRQAWPGMHSWLAGPWEVYEKNNL